MVGGVGGSMVSTPGNTTGIELMPPHTSHFPLEKLHEKPALLRRSSSGLLKTGIFAA